MAVYRRRYQAGSAPATALGSRFLVFTRYELRALLGSRLFALHLALCFAAPLVGAVLIYLHYNPLGLKLIEASVRDLIPIDGEFFLRLLIIQTTLGSLLAAVVGPGLVAPDLANNALPLYLSRPIRRRDYVIGKLVVLIAVMSVLTWLPMMLLFALQSVLQGWSWLAGNLRIALGIICCSVLWILVVSLLTLAISAWVRWRPIATLAVFGYFFVSSTMGALVNEVLGTRWGSLLIVAKLMRFLWSDFFGIRQLRDALPATASVVAIAATCLVFLVMLVHRVRAFEVVRS
jgi:ABC-2 type transport system permease protein